MYLSKLRLELSHPSVRRALRDCDDMHRNLMSAFEDVSASSARAQLKLLYRMVESRQALHLLLYSAQKPDAAALQRNGFYIEGTKDLSALQGALPAGRFLRFELLTMPFQKHAGSGKNSRRVFIRDAQERMQWLERKALQNGFRVECASEDANARRIVGRRAGEAIVYSAVNFSGILQITDAERFWQAYSEGIGAGKAYGMGMLVISAL